MYGPVNFFNSNDVNAINDDNDKAPLPSFPDSDNFDDIYILNTFVNNDKITNPETFLYNTHKDIISGDVGTEQCLVTNTSNIELSLDNEGEGEGGGEVEGDGEGEGKGDGEGMGEQEVEREGDRDGVGVGEVVREGVGDREREKMIPMLS